MPAKLLLPPRLRKKTLLTSMPPFNSPLLASVLTRLVLRALLLLKREMPRPSLLPKAPLRQLQTPLHPLHSASSNQLRLRHLGPHAHQQRRMRTLNRRKTLLMERLVRLTLHRTMIKTRSQCLRQCQGQLNAAPSINGVVLRRESDRYQERKEKESHLKLQVRRERGALHALQHPLLVRLWIIRMSENRKSRNFSVLPPRQILASETVTVLGSTLASF